MTSIADVQRLLRQADAATAQVQQLAVHMHDALQARRDVILDLRSAGMTYAEIGRHLGGLSRERIRRIAQTTPTTDHGEVAA